MISNKGVSGYPTHFCQHEVVQYLASKISAHKCTVEVLDKNRVGESTIIMTLCPKNELFSEDVSIVALGDLVENLAQEEAP